MFKLYFTYTFYTMYTQYIINKKHNAHILPSVHNRHRKPLFALPLSRLSKTGLPPLSVWFTLTGPFGRSCFSVKCLCHNPVGALDGWQAVSIISSQIGI